MAFGGKDRTFKSIKTSPTSGGAAGALPEKPSFAQRAYQYLLAKLNNPDAYWSWRNPAIKLAKQVIKQNNIPVVFTTSPPFTTLEIGIALKKSLDIKWVADFRDPMIADCRNHAKDPNIFLKQYLIEKETAEIADNIVTASTAQKLIMTDQYGVEASKRICPILTGVDKALINLAAPTEPLSYLVFVGEYLSQYGDEFFKIFKETLKDSQVNNKHLRLKIVGVKTVNEPRILPILKELGIESSVDFIDHLPQQEVYKLVQNSLGGVLCSSRAYPWWTAYSKVADYVALNKPVVAVVPNPSEARKWLSLTGLGIFLDGNISECAKTLKDFVLNPKNHKADENQRQKFFVDYQVKEFEKVFLGDFLNS
jgi:glycosyltransferase involved in cell wall biosynthesis